MYRNVYKNIRSPISNKTLKEMLRERELTLGQDLDLTKSRRAEESSQELTYSGLIYQQFQALSWSRDPWKGSWMEWDETLCSRRPADVLILLSFQYFLLISLLQANETVHHSLFKHLTFHVPWLSYAILPLLECPVFFYTHLDPLVLFKTQPQSQFLLLE